LLFTEGLIAMFENVAVDIVDTSTSQKGLVKILDTNEVDVILLDLNLDGEDGFEIIDYLIAHNYTQKIIVLTSYNSYRIVKKIRTKNIAGFVLKNTSKSNLLTAINSVFEGKEHFDKIICEPHYLDPEIKYSDDFIKKHNLSEREYEVLILLAKSYSTKEIADVLLISEQTVSTYRKYIKSKLKLKSIADIVHFVFVNKLL